MNSIRVSEWSNEISLTDFYVLYLGRYIIKKCNVREIFLTCLECDNLGNTVLSGCCRQQVCFAQILFACKVVVVHVIAVYKHDY
jgi:hypothetical protein